MRPILSAAPFGRQRLFWHKMGAAALVSLMAFVIIQCRELLLIRKTYGQWVLQAPASSLKVFEGLPSFMTLGGLLALFISIRFLVLLCVSGVVCLISVMVKHTRAAVLYGTAVLALPQALYCMGAEKFGKLSFGNAWLPFNCSLSTFIVCYTLGITAYVLIRILWLRKK